MENHDKIDDFFQGKLSGKELKDFDNAIQNDDALSDEIAFRLASRKALKSLDKERRIERMRKAVAQAKAQRKRRKWLWGIISLLLLLGVIGWWLLNKPTNVSTEIETSESTDTQIQDSFREEETTIDAKESLQDIDGSSIRKKENTNIINETGSPIETKKSSTLEGEEDERIPSREDSMNLELKTDVGEEEEKPIAIDDPTGNKKQEEVEVISTNKDKLLAGIVAEEMVEEFSFGKIMGDEDKEPIEQKWEVWYEAKEYQIIIDKIAHLPIEQLSDKSQFAVGLAYFYLGDCGNAQIWFDKVLAMKLFKNDLC